MPTMPAASQPWKTARSRPRRFVGGHVEVGEVGVLGAAVGVAQLAARDRECRAQLDQRQHAALLGRDTPSTGASTRLDAAEVRGRVLPAVRAGEVDELARGERGRQPLARLVVDAAPRRLR